MGYVYIIFSALSFCFMTIFVKIAGHEVNTLQIVFFRGLFTLCVTYYFIYKNKIYIWGNNKKKLISRGLSGTFALFFVYESIQRITLSEATVIQYLYPIFTIILAAIFLGEESTKKNYLAIFIGLFGVYIVLDFPFLNSNISFNYNNVLIALIGSVLTALAYVLVRSCSNDDESPYVIMFYFPLFTVPLSLPFTIINWSNPSLNTWFYIFMVGLCTQLGQTFLTFGYKLIPASKAATASYVQVPFAALGGFMFFNEEISINFLAGSLIIFVAVSLIIDKKMKKKNKVFTP